MNDTERRGILQELLEGFTFLATAEPSARLSFVYDIRPIQVTSAPGPYPGVANRHEQYERSWRDEALASLGYEAGEAGVQAYARHLRSSRNTPWACIIFVTKYLLGHFAYAAAEHIVLGPNHLDSQTGTVWNNWGGWELTGVHGVLAHEVCHIFGAADEYKESNCTCGSPHGHLQVPNNNCANCFPPGTQTDCLMAGNKPVLVLCQWTRGQVGWVSELFSTLYVIQNDMLHRVRPDGTYEKLHPETVWANTAAMAALGDSLYLIQNNMLHRVRPDGTYEKLHPETVWANTAAMASIT